MVRGRESGPCYFMPNAYRTYVYIDGFNLYYRAVKNTPYKWLDLKKLCMHLINPKHNIIKIKYFTAKISGSWIPINRLARAFISGLSNTIFLKLKFITDISSAIR